MGQMNLTYLDKILKDQYEGPIREQLNTSTILMTRLQKTSEFIQADGRKVIIPLMYGGPQAIGARGDNAALPTGDYSKYYAAESTVKHNYGRIQVSGATIRASKTNAGAFAKAIDSEIQNMAKYLKRDINRQFLTSDGNGILAYVASISSTTLTLQYAGGVTGAASVNPTMYFEPNMRIDSYTGSSQAGNSLTVSSVNESAGTVTLAAVTSIVEGDSLHREDSRGYEMTGLYAIVDDGTVAGTIWGVDSSSYSFWKSKVLHNDGNKRDITPTLLQSGYTHCEKQGLAPTLGLCSFELRDSYASQLTSLRQFVNTKKLDFGFEALEYNNVPIVPDFMCPTSIFFWLVEPELAIHVQADFAWADENGHVLEKVAGYDAYEAFMYYDAQLGTFRRNAHCIIKDLQ